MHIGPGNRRLVVPLDIISEEGPRYSQITALPSVGEGSDDLETTF